MKEFVISEVKAVRTYILKLSRTGVLYVGNNLGTFIKQEKAKC